jgi:hypothetical protein
MCSSKLDFTRKLKVGADIISHPNKSEILPQKTRKISFLSGPSVDLGKSVICTPSIQGILNGCVSKHGGKIQ